MSRFSPLLVIASFLAGLLTAYRAWGMDLAAAQAGPRLAPPPASPSVPPPAYDVQDLIAQVNPPGGRPLGVSYGDLGPRLLAAGVIDYEAFVALYDDAGAPISSLQRDALTRGSDAAIVINAENSSFLLNFFWAVGLANQNPILTAGQMIEYSQGQIERFASTGGWSLSSRPIAEIYASLPLITLKPSQQARLEQVASAVYRPCCGNPTSFPDCNHGMAMLGLLELMASRDATTDEMFAAAKYVNAFWFPQQALESAIYLKTARGIDFAAADPRLVTSSQFASGSGSAAVRRELQFSGLLPESAAKGGNCAN